MATDLSHVLVIRDGLEGKGCFARGVLNGARTVFCWSGRLWLVGGLADRWGWVGALVWRWAVRAWLVVD